MLALRRTSAVLLSLIVAAGAAATPAGAVVAPLWDHPGYDAEDSHYNPRETAINAGSIRRLTKKWQVSLRKSDQSCSGFSAPVLSGGRIYTSDQLGVSAYAADSGKLAWRYDWDDPMDSETPRLAVADGLVILAGGGCNSQSDPDGNLTTLDAGTGLPRWKLRLDIPILSVVVDKNVIVASGGSPSDEDAVIAYAVRDGRELWNLPQRRTSGVSADGTILVRSTDGSGIAAGTSAGVLIESGKQRWTRKADWTAQAADPASSRFFVTDKAGVLSAVRVTDGQPAWTAAATLPNEMIAVDSQRVYRVAGKKVEALNVADGKRVWGVQQQAEGVQPVLAGGLLYTGGPVLHTGNGLAAGPALAGSVIVAGGRIHQVENGVLKSFAP